MKGRVFLVIFSTNVQTSSHGAQGYCDSIYCGRRVCSNSAAVNQVLCFMNFLSTCIWNKEKVLKCLWTTNIAIDDSHNPVYQNKTRHISFKLYLFREVQQNGDITLVHLSFADNLAEPLPGGMCRFSRKKFGVCSSCKEC